MGFDDESLVMDSVEDNTLKRPLLEDISSTVLQMSPSDCFPMPKSIVDIKRQRTMLPVARPSNERSRLMRDHDQIQPRFTTADALNLAKVSAGFTLKFSESALPKEGLSIEEKIKRSEEKFQAELLSLQTQTENNNNDSIDLKQQISDLEITNTKIKSNTQKLKEELYEINSKKDELQMMIDDVRSQNMKRLRVKEKELKLDGLQQENKLNAELYEMEKSLKYEYEEVILKYNDDVAQEELKQLKQKLEEKSEQLEKQIQLVNKNLTEFEQESGINYELALTKLEEPLEQITSEIERKQIEFDQSQAKLNELKGLNNDLQREILKLQSQYDEYKDSLLQDQQHLQERLNEIEKYQLQIEEMKSSYMVKLTQLQKTQSTYDQELSKLQIEKNRNRRVLHQIYYLRGKRRCFMNLANFTGDVIDTGLARNQLTFRGGQYEFDSIYQDENDELINDIQLLIDDSLSGVPVAVVNIGDSPSLRIGDAIKMIEKLIKKSKSQISMTCQCIDYISHKDSLSGIPVTVNIEGSELQLRGASEVGSLSEIGNVTENFILHCKLTISNTESTITFISMPSDRAIDIEKLIQVESNNATSWAYNYTKNLTLLDINLTSDNAIKLMTLGLKVNRSDTTSLTISK